MIIQTEGLEYLRKFFELARTESVAMLPFIPPVNYEFARKLFGADFDKGYGDNVKKVRELVEAAKYHCRNPSSSFTIPEISAKSSI